MEILINFRRIVKGLKKKLLLGKFDDILSEFLNIKHLNTNFFVNLSLILEHCGKILIKLETFFKIYCKLRKCWKILEIVWNFEGILKIFEILLTDFVKF